jgi:predicted O-methyltransferase YrrM
MVTCRPRPSERELPHLLAGSDRFDLAFVDGSHHFDAVFIDLFYLGRLLRPGAIVFLDDYQLPSVAHAASFFITNLAWTIEQATTSPDHHWIVLRSNPSPDQRPFGHFVEF